MGKLATSPEPTLPLLPGLGISTSCPEGGRRPWGLVLGTAGQLRAGLGKSCALPAFPARLPSGRGPGCKDKLQLSTDVAPHVRRRAGGRRGHGKFPEAYCPWPSGGDSPPRVGRSTRTNGLADPGEGMGTARGPGQEARSLHKGACCWAGLVPEDPGGGSAAGIAGAAIPGTGSPK